MTFNSLMMHLFFILSNKILYVLLQLIFMIILFMHSFIEKCNWSVRHFIRDGTSIWFEGVTEMALSLMAFKGTSGETSSPRANKTSSIWHLQQ